MPVTAVYKPKAVGNWPMFHRYVAEFTGNEDKDLLNLGDHPMTKFSLQVFGVAADGVTPVALTAWNVSLLRAPNGMQGTTFLQHSSGASNTNGQTVEASATGPICQYYVSMSGLNKGSAATAIVLVEAIP